MTESEKAWVTLATNDSYALGAVVLANSLKRVNATGKIVVMITPGISSAMRSVLDSTFDVVTEVNVLDSEDTANLALLTRPELGITFTKLHCWRLTQYDKCVFMDADTMVLQNCDELFNREEFSAAPDSGWPDCFNSGVFVFRPSLSTYEQLLQFAVEQGSFDGGDQGLLNSYFSDWSTADIGKKLPFTYNMVASATYSYLPAYRVFGQNVKIAHFIGPSKPWMQFFDSSTGRVQPEPGQEHLQELLQAWWDIFRADVHPRLTPEMGGESATEVEQKGLAGAYAKMSFEGTKSQDQLRHEDAMRKNAWEQGRMDYLGADSFDNIMKKIQASLAQTALAQTPRAKSPSPPKVAKLRTPPPPEPSPSPSAPVPSTPESATETKSSQESQPESSQPAAVSVEPIISSALASEVPVEQKSEPVVEVKQEPPPVVESKAETPLVTESKQETPPVTESKQESPPVTETKQTSPPPAKAEPTPVVEVKQKSPSPVETKPVVEVKQKSPPPVETKPVVEVKQKSPPPVETKPAVDVKQKSPPPPAETKPTPVVEVKQKSPPPTESKPTPVTESKQKSPPPAEIKPVVEVKQKSPPPPPAETKPTPAVQSKKKSPSPPKQSPAVEKPKPTPVPPVAEPPGKSAEDLEEERLAIERQAIEKKLAEQKIVAEQKLEEEKQRAAAAAAAASQVPSQQSQQQSQPKAPPRGKGKGSKKSKKQKRNHSTTNNTKPMVNGTKSSKNNATNNTSSKNNKYSSSLGYGLTLSVLVLVIAMSAFLLPKVMPR